MSRHYPSLALFVVLCIGIGALGEVATRPAMVSWYSTLAKPPWTPPAWIFGPVWTTLYVMIGLAGWRVWMRRESSPSTSWALRFFAVQLLLNAIWSPIFFGLHRPLLALFDIVGLWATILATYLAMRKVDAISGWLFVPYLCWVSFAACLNASIWWMNQ